ncbi:unnamed protein product [Paramecium octaurelia]|uniref:Uncharacterized protein n=1 Tax=Paramecium octaurelia TaxID=43137 RepID=A0A8S1W909_PAROT|nr:unnamed protein product [Paramecium octaurelia]
MNSFTQSVRKYFEQSNRKKLEVKVYDSFKKLIQKGGLLNKDKMIVYQDKDEILRKIWEQIQYLKWFCEYDQDWKIFTKWIAIWNGEIMTYVGGIVKLQKQEHKTKMKQIRIMEITHLELQEVQDIRILKQKRQIFESGEYTDDEQDGRWNYINQEPNSIMGWIILLRYKDWKVERAGWWIYDDKQVIYSGEYKNGKKVDIWNLEHEGDQCKKQKQKDIVVADFIMKELRLARGLNWMMDLILWQIQQWQKGSQLVQKYDGNLLKKKEIFSEIEVVRDLIMMEQRLESRQSYMMDFLLNNKQPIEGNIKMVKRFVNGIFKEIQLLQDIQNLIMLVDHMMKELRLPNELSWMMILFEKLVTHSGEYQNGKKQVGGILMVGDLLMMKVGYYRYDTYEEQFVIGGGQYNRIGVKFGEWCVLDQKSFIVRIQQFIVPNTKMVKKLDVGIYISSIMALIVQQYESNGDEVKIGIWKEKVFKFGPDLFLNYIGLYKIVKKLVIQRLWPGEYTKLVVDHMITRKRCSGKSWMASLLRKILLLQGEFDPHSKNWSMVVSELGLSKRNKNTQKNQIYN